MEANFVINVKELYALADVTTVLDTLFKGVLTNMGISIMAIHGASIFAFNEFKFKSEGNGYVLVNYMKGWAHYTFGQNINFVKETKEFRKIYYKLKKGTGCFFKTTTKKKVHEA